MLEFETRSHNKYMYDDGTGMVFYRSNLLDISLSGTQPEVIYWSKFVKRWEKVRSTFERSTFKKSEAKKMISEENIQKHLITYGNGFKQMILNVTDDCNMRCKYCIFSENYPMHRDYSDSYMNFDIAKQAVDYYFRNFEKVYRRNPTRRPVIGFYGGEPLLNFGLIKEVVKYIHKKYSDYNTFYNITTNGTLLSGERLDFLIHNDFAIAISLDGPKEEHDRNRVFINGRGTFETVMENLENLKKKSPNFTKCTVISTYDPKTDLIKCKNFFDENELKLPFLSRVDMVMPNFTSYYARFNKNDIERLEAQKDELREEYFKKVLPENEVRGYLGIFIGVPYLNLLIRPIGRVERSPLMPHTGSCIPGEKISVKPDGTYNMCERINDNFPIGSVDTGLDYQIIKRLLLDYIGNITPNCENCPIQRLCSLCFAQCGGREHFRKDLSNVCESMKKDVIERLGDLYTIFEKNPGMYTKLATTYYRDLLNNLEWMEGL